MYSRKLIDFLVFEKFYSQPKIYIYISLLYGLYLLLLCWNPLEELVGLIGKRTIVNS